MKTVLIYLVIFLAYYLNCSCNLKREETKRNVIEQEHSLTITQSVDRTPYDSLLLFVVSQVITDDTINLKMLKEIIPKTEKQFLSYYSLTSPDNLEKTEEAFYKIDDKIFNLACNGDIDFFELYLKMVEFVDGEYAESYFENVEIAISRSEKEFHKIYPLLNDECSSRLKEFY